MLKRPRDSAYRQKFLQVQGFHAKGWVWRQQSYILRKNKERVDKLNIEKSIGKNMLFNFLKVFSSTIFPMATFTYSARILGVAAVGEVSFVRCVISWFCVAAMLGVGYYGRREAARLRDDKIALSRFVHEMLFINAGAVLLSYVVLLFLLCTIERFWQCRELLLIHSVLIVLMGMGMEWLYQALEEYQYIAVRTVLFQVISLLLMLLLVKDADDVTAYAVILVIASSGSYLLNFLNCRNYISFSWYGQYEFRKHLRPVFTLLALALSAQFYTVLDSVMLGFFKGNISVGIYTAASKTVGMTSALINALTAVMIPRLSYYMGKSKLREVKMLMNQSIHFMFMFAIPAMLGLFVLSDEIILLFSGNGFGGAETTMRWLIPVVVASSFSYVAGEQLVSLGREQMVLLAGVAGAVTNVICNAILITGFAHHGAAVASVLAESVVALVSFFHIKDFIDKKSVIRICGQFLVASLPIILIRMFIKATGFYYIWQVLFTIVLSGILYFSCLLLMKNECARITVQTVRDGLQKF